MTDPILKARIESLKRYKVSELDDMLMVTTDLEGSLVSLEQVLAALVGEEPPKVIVSGGAMAGITDARGGESGAVKISIGNHEIMDLALSGQAYSLDGRYNFLNDSPLLDRAWKAYESSRVGEEPPAAKEGK